MVYSLAKLLTAEIAVVIGRLERDKGGWKQDLMQGSVRDSKRG